MNKKHQIPTPAHREHFWGHRRGHGLAKGYEEGSLLRCLIPDGAEILDAASPE